MGYKTQGVDPASEFAFANGTQSSSDDIVYPKPDFSQMIPYKVVYLGLFCHSNFLLVVYFSSICSQKQDGLQPTPANCWE